MKAVILGVAAFFFKAIIFLLFVICYLSLAYIDIYCGVAGDVLGGFLILEIYSVIVYLSTE